MSVLEQGATKVYDFIDLTANVNSMGLPSVRVSPREKDIGEYHFRLLWAELFTQELYAIESELNVKFLEDTAADAAITEFDDLLDDFLEGL